jgi:hypothetical protein
MYILPWHLLVQFFKKKIRLYVDYTKISNFLINTTTIGFVQKYKFAFLFFV